MKSKLIIAYIVSLTLFAASCGNRNKEKLIESKSTDSSTVPADSIPKVNIGEITIGTQTWAIANLDVSYFRNGDSIPQAKTDEEWLNAGKPAWCYYNNDPENGKKYGKLYNWYAVHDKRGLAPEGWHIPTPEEWDILTDYLGGKKEAVAKMKSTSGWNEEKNGNNSSGFNALPGGCRRNYGTFAELGTSGLWFSYYMGSTIGPSIDGDNVIAEWLDGSEKEIGGGGFSVRCVKDK